MALSECISLDALFLVPTHMKEIKEELTELRKGIEYVMKHKERLTKDNSVKTGLIQDLQQELYRVNQLNENYMRRYKLLIDGIGEKAI